MSRLIPVDPGVQVADPPLGLRVAHGWAVANRTWLWTHPPDDWGRAAGIGLTDERQY